MRHRTWWAFLFTGVGIAGLMAVVICSGWISDDYYFSLKAARLLVDGYGLQHNAAERVQGFSNPLWTLLLAGNFLLLDHHYLTTLALSFLATLGVALILVNQVARTTGRALLGIVILTSSKAFVDFSTSGLENPLSHLLFMSFLATWHSTPVPRNHAGRLGLLAALLIFTRLDLSLLVLPHLLLLLLLPGRDRGSRLRLMAGMLPLAAWLLFALLYYGSPFPNTALAKMTSEEGIRYLLMVRGWAYLVNSLGWDRITLPIIAAAILAGFIIKPRSRNAATATGLSIYVLYIIWVGGDFMIGRFLTVPFTGAVVLLLRIPVRRRPGAAFAAALLIVGISLSCARSPLRLKYDDIRRKGITTDHHMVDERLYYYAKTGVMSRWRAGTIFRKMDPIKDRKATVKIISAGRESYVVTPRTHIVNKFGLTDPLLPRLPTKEFATVRVGHYRYWLPAGYLESLRSGENRIEDPEIAKLWDDVVQITRRPILNRKWFSAMWRLHLGLHDIKYPMPVRWTR